MTTQTGTRYVDTAEVAKLIRRRLGVVFPGQSFRVRISRYSGGSSVTVCWADGPRTAEVEAEIKPFEGKGFDGMIDLGYGMETWLLPDGSAQRASVQGTVGSMGTVSDYATDAPHPNAELIRATCYIFCSRSVSNEEQQFSEAAEYIRQHCRCDGTPPADRFGRDWVTDLAHGMAWDRGGGEDWTVPFRRIVLRQTG